MIPYMGMPVMMNYTVMKVMIPFTAAMVTTFLPVATGMITLKAAPAMIS